MAEPRKRIWGAGQGTVNVKFYYAALP